LSEPLQAGFTLDPYTDAELTLTGPVFFETIKHLELLKNNRFLRIVGSFLRLSRCLFGGYGFKWRLFSSLALSVARAGMIELNKATNNE
jgi:hypothetical protein